MQKKKKGKRDVQHELESEAEYIGLSDEEKEYLDQFNKEWYYGSRHVKGYEINYEEDMQKECNRNNNRNNRDIFDVTKRAGMLEELTDNEKDFMDQASDEWEWQDVYKMLGKDHAIHVIFEQARRDIEEGAIDLNIILSRFFIKMISLEKIDKRRKKQGKKR